MAETLRSQVWIGRGLFAALALTIIFAHLLPLGMEPSVWAPPIQASNGRQDQKFGHPRQPSLGIIRIHEAINKRRMNSNLPKFRQF